MDTYEIKLGGWTAKVQAASPGVAIKRGIQNIAPHLKAARNPDTGETYKVTFKRLPRTEEA